jgi:uncharacterized protein (DUF1800 family)
MSATMQIYLDNCTNTGASPNENYAREIMELHTMGADGGYTQQDVAEVARCFTGCGTFVGENEQQWFTFQFHPQDHDDGPKTVLGNTIPAGGGMNDGLAVIDILMAHPSTANFVAKKLCRRFWGYDPPASLVSAVAASFTSTSGDIKSMVRTLFENIDPADVPLKLKRPYHLYVSAMRATGAEHTGVAYAYDSAIRQQLKSGGHEPYQWGPPNGYPDKFEHWSGLILPRWNFGLALMYDELAGQPGVYAGQTVDLAAFLNGAFGLDPVMNQIDARLFGNQMPSAERARITSYLSADPSSEYRIREAIALAIASPAFQWY